MPRGSVGKKIAVTSTVETLPDHSRLEYRGAKPITIDNAIKMTNICLRPLDCIKRHYAMLHCRCSDHRCNQGPMTCDIFFSKNPTMCKNDDLWVRRSHPENVAGHTRRGLPFASVKRGPQTQPGVRVAKRLDAQMPPRACQNRSMRRGPQYVFKVLQQVQVHSGKVGKAGRGGCCEGPTTAKPLGASPSPSFPRVCFGQQVVGPHRTKSLRPDHCCVPKLCASSICNSSQWEAKPGNVLGSTKEECCTPRDCDDYTCASKFVKKAKRRDFACMPSLAAYCH